MLLLRLACAAYSLLLTLLLLLPQPLVLLGFAPPSGQTSGRGAHFVTFALLATLVVMSRVPWRRNQLIAVLVSYAFATELLQGLIPHRSVELLDFVENLLGLATGAAIAWALGRSPTAGTQKRTSRPNPPRSYPSGDYCLPGWRNEG